MCSATCWLSAEQTSLIGGALVVPLRSGLCDTAGGNLMRPKAETRSVIEKQCCPHVVGRCRPCGTCPANRRDQKPRRGVCSEEQCRPHVVRRCRQCGTCTATNRRGACHLTAVVVAFVGGRALPPLRSHPKSHQGLWWNGIKQRLHEGIEREYSPWTCSIGRPPIVI